MRKKIAVLVQIKIERTSLRMEELQRNYQGQLITLASRPELLPQIETIFFTSSNIQNFASEIDRQLFRDKWLGQYVEHMAEHILVVTYQNKVRGYLTGCLDSMKAAHLFQNINYYNMLTSHYSAYPAHFHINVHTEDRNKGIGTKLVSAFLDICRERSTSGVHVVTNKNARNVNFYHHSGFKPVTFLQSDKNELVMLGRTFE